MTWKEKLGFLLLMVLAVYAGGAPWGCEVQTRFVKARIPEWGCGENHYPICITKGGAHLYSYCVEHHSVTVSHGELCVFGKVEGIDDALVVCGSQHSITVLTGECEEP